MKSKKVILNICLFVGCISFSFGQDIVGNIAGEVRDKQSQTALPGTTIVVYTNDDTFGTTSNSDGNFHISNIPVGRVSVIVTFIGYHPISFQNLELTSKKTLFLEVELLEKIESLEGVTITAYQKDKAINEFATVSSRTFTVEESNKFAGSWGDPARMVSNYAGIVTAGDQRNDIIIRGNSPVGLVWRLDGIGIPNPNHFGTYGTTGGPISILNNNQLSNSDFYTGAFPAEFGNALSGAFDLKMRRGNSQNHEFMGQMGFNGFELGAEGPISRKNNSTYMINYRYTMMDVMSAMGLFDVGGIPKYSDVSFKLSLPTTSMGTFSLIGLGGMSSIQLEEDKGSGWTSDMPPGTQVFNGSKMGVLGLSHKYFFSISTRLETALSTIYSNSFNDVDTLQGETYTPFYSDNYNETRLAFSTKLISKINDRNTLQVGGIVEHFFFNFYDETRIPGLDEVINDTDIRENTELYQGFVQLRHGISDNLFINAGIHGQVFALNGSGMVEPRLGISYNLSSKHSLSLGYGLHGQTQPKLIYFVRTNHSDSPHDYTLTNRELGFSKSHHFVAGYDYRISTNLRLKIETYHQSLYDIPVETGASYFSLINYGANFYNEKIDSLTNSGKGKNSGVELTLEKFLSKNFYFLLTTSLFDSKYQGSDGLWRNTAFNGNYTVNMLAGYELPLKTDALAFNIKMIWAGGKRYIPINIEQSILHGEAVYSYSEAYTPQFDDYFRVDLRISYRKNSKSISQEWSFDVQNLTNHSNIFMQRYDNDTQSVVNVLQMKFFPIGSWKIYF
ncbi:MAG: TonB-dependent receptor [Bacteroidales bacterium]|nr:TonB-dependent receptor [Bacteroidales bacterium]